MQLLLLAQICSVWEDGSDASAAATGDSSSLQPNAEGAEALLGIIKAADQLPELLLGLVKTCVEQLQSADGKAQAGLLAEALPGEAPGCGELLKSNVSSCMTPR